MAVAMTEPLAKVPVRCPHCKRLLFYSEPPRTGKEPTELEYKCPADRCRRVVRLLVPPPVAEAS